MRNRGNKQKINNKMVDLSPNLSVVPVNVSGLNTPTEGQKDRYMAQSHTVHKKLTSSTMTTLESKRKGQIMLRLIIFRSMNGYIQIK